MLCRVLRPSPAHFLRCLGSARLVPCAKMSVVRPPSQEPPDQRPDKRPRIDPLPPDSQSASSADIPNPPKDSRLDAVPPACEGDPSSKRRQKRKKVRKPVPIEPFTAEWVVQHEVEKLLGKPLVDQALADGTEWAVPFVDEGERIVEVTVSALSSGGDSLSLLPGGKRPWVIVTPLALPGERIRVRVYRHARLHSYADLVEIITPNPEWRDMSRVRCKYFGQCGGCQYQMLSYEKQLELKHNAIVRAYENYSDLAPVAVPEIQPTIGSPLQYNYRTKITPHFDSPVRLLRDQPLVDPANWLKIGFNVVGTRRVIDIEECPIATETINETMNPVRARIRENIHSYKNGVSLLFRDSLEIPSDSHLSRSPSRSRSPSHGPSPSHIAPPPRSKSPKRTLVPLVVPSDRSSPPYSRGIASDASPPSAEKHVCVTDHKAIVRERVGDALFDYKASSFFQNNNSVLVPLISYVRDAISAAAAGADSAPTHLVDAYCGAGLFAITLARDFQRVVGIELSQESIQYAIHNAKLNSLRHAHCSFLAGDAADIFATVQDFPRARTALIIDPPRKGTTERFIEQMIDFGCETVVYVSCNVHTQARDVGVILRKSEEKGGRKYVLQSLRGFDLFPQTAHVESVAVLCLV